MKAMLKCSVCGEILELEVGFTGADWDCKAGEGSGYGYVIHLVCNECGLVYPIGNLKNEFNFSPVIDKYKVVK